MAAEDGVEPAHARGQFQVDVHAVVRQQHDHLCALAARLVDHRLQVFFLDAEAPVGDEVRRVGDRRVREGLADDRDRHAVGFADHIGLEHGVAEVAGLDVVGDEVDRAGEVLGDDLLHPLGAEREFPVAGHDVDTEQLAGVDHVLSARPQRRRRTLPGIAAIDQQGTGTRGAHLLDQRGQVRKTADPPVPARGLDEIEMGERVRRGRVRLQTIVLQESVADQMRRTIERAADADIDRGLAEVDRLQLRVAVGEMQQVDVALFRARRRARQTGSARRPTCRAARQGRRHRGRGQHPQELATMQAHGAARLTGEVGSKR